MTGNVLWGIIDHWPHLHFFCHYREGLSSLFESLCLLCRFLKYVRLYSRGYISLIFWRCFWVLSWDYMSCCLVDLASSTSSWTSLGASQGSSRVSLLSTLFGIYINKLESLLRGHMLDGDYCLLHHALICFLLFADDLILSTSSFKVI